MNQWGSSPWGHNDGQPTAPGMAGSPFGPPVFGASPGFPSYSTQAQGWGQPGYGYPPQFTPQPPQEPRRNRKAIALIVAAVVVIVVLVAGSTAWWYTSGGSDAPSEADAAAGKAEVAREERAAAAVNVPSLSSPPKVLWSYPPGGWPLIMGGDSQTVIISLNNSIIALDAARGSVLWRQPLPSSFGSLAHCVVSTSSHATLCAGGKEAVLLDMATGATKESLSAQGVSGIAQVFAGAGLLAFVDDKKNLTVFDDSGQQLWAKPLTGSASVFLDQGIVAEAGLSTTFYDAKTGDKLFAIDAVDDLVATSRGIAVSQRSGGDISNGMPRQRIDFYSFTGKLAWRITGDRGYRLPVTNLMSGTSFPRSVQYSTSGVALPIVYSQDKGEIAAVDTVTGDFKWTQQVSFPQKNLVRLTGVGGLCIVSYTEVVPAREERLGQGAVRVRDCNDGTGAFIPRSELSDLIATDGNQIVGRADTGPVSAYDTATGQRTWQLPGDVRSVTWVGDGLYTTDYDKGVVRLS